MRLDDGGRIDARVAVAADGAESTLRQLAGGEVSRHDYGQRGVVAYIETGQPHEDTAWRSEEHTSELQSLMRISYAVFCLKKKKIYKSPHISKINRSTHLIYISKILHNKT